MKKLFSLICLFVTCLTIYAQENLIEDGKFEDTSFTVYDIYRKFPGPGKWYPYLTSDKQAVMSVIQDNDKGKAVSIQTLTGTSYAYSFIGQRVEKNVSEGIYTLKFWAKATKDIRTSVGVYLKVKTPKSQTLYFPISGFDPQTTPSRSGALKTLILSNEWKEYTVEFDLSQVVNSVPSPKVSKTEVIVKKSEVDHRKSFDVAIACMTKNSGMLFTDVSLVKKN
ncbi:DUF4627 domain-containing protein [Parapedobacter sp. SGR-10]|uniref:DUF4627 domain-containing protein n=1 Tax=Parapedobacter sp. SGR-10 TaxID=2710879 RepID=UPI0013D3EFC4|nr:DUF4627 domain-containing protein [Parapedobacter sp. SGR-10]NGF56601.1 DUF4627 domain-containing protein [Parapedobacter sp. SGR-10]